MTEPPALTLGSAGSAWQGGRMDQRISFVTLAVGDPDGFRWEIATNPRPIGQEVLP